MAPIGLLGGRISEFLIAPARIDFNTTLSPSKPKRRTWCTTKKYLSLQVSTPVPKKYVLRFKVSE